MKERQEKLPLRDLWLLPLISLLTIALLFSSAEITARFVWPERKEDSCIAHDPVLGHKFKPNCTSLVKLAEGPWVTNRFNNCGYRSASSCGAKPPGVVRVAVIGSSFAEGYMVPYEELFTTLASRQLTSSCRTRKVEFQNLAVPEFGLIQMYKRTEEAIVLKPDLALISITPHDLNFDIDANELANRRVAKASAEKSFASRTNLYSRFRNALRSSRTLEMIQHYLFADDARYVRLYLSYAALPGFMRRPVPAEWQKHYADADLLLGEMADEFHKAGVPVFLMPGVLHDQGALAHLHQQRQDMDAFSFYRTVAAISAKHSMFFVDTMTPFVNLKSTAGLFYPVDSHPTASAQAIFANALDKGILDAGTPVFRNCEATTLASAHRLRTQ